jgi:tetraacyldisaccharide 4'-kinase
VLLLRQLAGGIARARRRFFATRPEARRRLARPVISVGNLSVGGSGKTPVVHWLAAHLRDRGWRPSILSRGYKRRDPSDGVVIVGDGERLFADVPRACDEPFMLARCLPGIAVLVCADRFVAGRLAEHHLGCTLHLLDDGFQHFGLERDVDLLVVGDADLRQARVLPFGRLREPLDAARNADAILWTGEGDARDVAARLGVLHGFRLERHPGPIETAMFGDVAPPSSARVVAVAGVARPEPFFDALQTDGFEVTAGLRYPDHHVFTAVDLSAMAARVTEGQAWGVVTTEKDMVRLLASRPLPFRLAWRSLEARIQPEADFLGWVEHRLELRQAFHGVEIVT